MIRMKNRGSDESSSSEEEEEESNESGSGSSDDSDEVEHKAKGVQGLIEIENPNRAVKKTAEKVSKINLSAAGSSKQELSRREREELEKQRAQANYQKMHAEGKTDQARADLARLAIIKQVTSTQYTVIQKQFYFINLYLFHSFIVISIELKLLLDEKQKNVKKKIE